ncbi:DNA cytosine methyltransferase [Mycoplasmopsis cynos]
MNFNLVWQIYRILSESKKKPKYLMMENVQNLLSKKFILNTKSENYHLKN